MSTPNAPLWKQFGFKSLEELEGFHSWLMDAATERRVKEIEEEDRAYQAAESQSLNKRKRASRRTASSKRVDYFESDDSDYEREPPPKKGRSKQPAPDQLEQWSEDEPDPEQDALLPWFIQESGDDEVNSSDDFGASDAETIGDNTNREMGAVTDRENSSNDEMDLEYDEDMMDLNHHTISEHSAKQQQQQ
ncbi:unnamed protein product [Clonostachys rosea]|uniref:Uncharacterized protein n=1 Tax=Bionectria ochroleuca TaxID=29856 RepID=A0ABY6UZT2_BIOOC|nr:unnamed protein product [Clonostachys rosea]